jgi:hypothetical protein
MQFIGPGVNRSPPYRRANAPAGADSRPAARRVGVKSGATDMRPNAKRPVRLVVADGPSLPLCDSHAAGRAHLTSELSLKIGRMMLIAMKPTMPPMTTIMIGSIMAVTPLMTVFSSRL